MSDYNVVLCDGSRDFSSTIVPTIKSTAMQFLKHSVPFLADFSLLIVR